MNFEAWISQQIGKLEAEGLVRRPRTLREAGPRVFLNGRAVLNFASNDYLGIANDNRLKAAVIEAVEKFGVGSGSARLLSGTSALHQGLETALAEHFSRPSAVSFSSGYLANIGALGAGRSRNDVVFSDRLVHASIVDGIGLSRMEHRRFRHNDLVHLEELLRSERERRSEASGEGRFLVVVESLYSMNGDRAPLAALSALAKKYDADLMVDEAHAVGVYDAGRYGDLVTGTLSKAFGSYGGFVLGPEGLPPFLHSLSRTYIFNTSLPPAICAAALAALEIVSKEPGRGEELLRRAEAFRARLVSAGLDCLGSESQIVPLLVGDREKTTALSERLLERGLFAPAIRPPTVPPGRERIRFSITLAQTEEEVLEAAETIVQAARDLGVAP